MKAKQVAEWILSLPPEYQDAEFTALCGSNPNNLKRIVAGRWKGSSELLVICNPLGTHFAFDNGFTWEHKLQL